MRPMIHGFQYSAVSIWAKDAPAVAGYFEDGAGGSAYGWMILLDEWKN